MIDKINEILYTPIVDREFIFIDFWSFVHFGIGYILGKIIPNMPLLALALIIGFEVVEMTIGVSLGIVSPEKLMDTIWDIIIGYGAYNIARFT